MPEFKVGDKVRVVQSHPMLSEGSIHTVAGFDRYDYVHLEGRRHPRDAWVPSRFELVVDETPTFKAGDRVLVRAGARAVGDDYTINDKDTIGEVRSGPDSDGDYYVRINGYQWFVDPQYLTPIATAHVITVDEDSSVEDGKSDPRVVENPTSLPAIADLPLDYALSVVEYIATRSSKLANL